MRDVWRTLCALAKAGEPWAIHEFLDRTLGRPAQATPEERADVAATLRALWTSLQPARDVAIERAPAVERVDG
jgi:hypothetical protein